MVGSDEPITTKQIEYIASSGYIYPDGEMYINKGVATGGFCYTGETQLSR